MASDKALEPLPSDRRAAGFAEAGKVYQRPVTVLVPLEVH